MDRSIIGKFKSLFEQERNNLIYTKSLLNEDFNIKSDDLLDEVDLSSCELEQSMRMRLRNREALYLKKIEEALDRIKDGSFGACENCEEDIEMRRLEARPTATLCVGCKEDEEKREHHHIDGHKPKSVGARLRFA